MVQVCIRRVYECKYKNLLVNLSVWNVNTETIFYNFSLKNVAYAHRQKAVTFKKCGPSQNPKTGSL